MNKKPIFSEQNKKEIIEAGFIEAGRYIKADESIEAGRSIKEADWFKEATEGKEWKMWSIKNEADLNVKRVKMGDPTHYMTPSTKCKRVYNWGKIIKWIIFIAIVAGITLKELFKII